MSSILVNPPEPVTRIPYRYPSPTSEEHVRTGYQNSPVPCPRTPRPQAGRSQPLQNWHPWVGADLKSLLRQSGNCSTGNQCYSAIAHLFRVRSTRPNPLDWPESPDRHLPEAFQLTLVGITNRNSCFCFIWSMLVTLLVTGIVLPVQDSMLTTEPNTVWKPVGISARWNGKESKMPGIQSSSLLPQWTRQWNLKTIPLMTRPELPGRWRIICGSVPGVVPERGILPSGAGYSQCGLSVRVGC